MRGKDGVAPATAQLKALLQDPAPIVRVQAATALARFGSSGDEAALGLKALVTLAHSERNDLFTAMEAVAALDAIGDKAAAVAADIRSLPERAAAPDQRYAEYFPLLVTDLKARFP